MSDMVVDRLHWMLCEKKKLEEQCAVIMQNDLEKVSRSKKKKLGAQKLLKMPENYLPQSIPRRSGHRLT
jgi:uncharacterized membrane-anchored protein